MDDPTRRTDPPSSATPEQDPLAETPYRFLRRLGEGGMGEVVEAEHVALGHRVAIKLLREEYFARVELKERMRVEAQACARLRHDNLVPVTDFGETAEGRVFIVMERLYGRPLGDELHERGALPVAEAVDIARQALAGLSAAHAAALVHRDVKPDNVFLCDQADGTRRVKLLDFGVARILSHAVGPLTPAPLAQPTADGLTVGTARWASPEQARGERDLDGRSDVYSMGWVLYTMLTGRAPFPRLKHPGELFAAHAGEVPALPSAVAAQPIPAELDAVVMKAIAKRREDRFESAEAFRAALAPFAEPAAAPALAPTIDAGPSAAAFTVRRAWATGKTMTQTVDTSEVALARPAIPWAPRTGRDKRPLPRWFLPLMTACVVVIAAITALYVLRAIG